MNAELSRVTDNAVEQKIVVEIEPNPLHVKDTENPEPTGRESRAKIGQTVPAALAHKEDAGVGVQMMTLNEAKSLSGGNDVDHFGKSSAQKQKEIEQIKDYAL